MNFFTPLIEKLNQSVSGILTDSQLEESYIAPSGTVNSNFNSNITSSSFSSEIVGNLSQGLDISDSKSPAPKIIPNAPLNSTFSEIEQPITNEPQSISILLNEKSVLNDSKLQSDLNDSKLVSQNLTNEKSFCISDNFEKSKIQNSPNFVSKNLTNEESLGTTPIPMTVDHGDHLKNINLQNEINPNEGYFCDTCKNKGCCQICKKVPCDASIQCSAKSCKKWTHYKCSDITEEESDSIKIYYCPPCRKSNPMLKNISYKAKKGRPKLKKLPLTQTKKPKKKRKSKTLISKNEDSTLSEKTPPNDINISQNCKNVSATLNSESFQNNKEVLNVTKEKSTPIKEAISNSQKVSSSKKQTLSKEKSSENSISEEVTSKKGNSENVTQLGEKLSISKNEFSDYNTSLDFSDEGSFSQPLNVSNLVKKKNIAVTGTELVEIFTKQLVNFQEEIFQLKQKINELETEKAKNNFTSNDKAKLNELENENLSLKLENLELTETIDKLERKLNLTNENISQLQKKYQESDYDVNKLDNLNMLQLKTKIRKQDQIIKAQEENFCKVLEMRDTFKTTLDKVNDENKKLDFKLKELVKNDVKNKVLNFALDENEKLKAALIMETNRALNFKNDNKNGEKIYNNKIDENKNLRHEISQLKTVIESNNMGLINKISTEDDEWESCSESSVEISNKTNSKKYNKTKNFKKPERKNPKNLKIFVPSKFTDKIDISQNTPVNKEICYFYTQGRCKFGKNCFNAHPKDYFHYNHPQKDQKTNGVFPQNGIYQSNSQKSQLKPYSTFPQNQINKFNSKIIHNSGPKKSNSLQDPSVSASHFSNYNHNGSQNNNYYQNENIAVPPQSFYKNRSENHNFNQIDEFQNHTIYFKNSNFANISESVPKNKHIPVIGTY